MKGDSRYMEIHLILALAIRGSLEIPRASALDLYSATSFLLNMLDIRTTMPHNLGT